MLKRIASLALVLGVSGTALTSSGCVVRERTRVTARRPPPPHRHTTTVIVRP